MKKSEHFFGRYEMNYSKPLPRIDNILWLAELAKPFPTTAGAVLSIAKKLNLSRNTIKFLRAFPSNEQFSSMDDFVARSEELELLIREERQMPRETLRSPQD